MWCVQLNGQYLMLQLLYNRLSRWYVWIRLKEEVPNLSKCIPVLFQGEGDYSLQHSWRETAPHTKLITVKRNARCDSILLQATDVIPESFPPNPMRECEDADANRFSSVIKQAVEIFLHLLCACSGMKLLGDVVDSVAKPWTPLALDSPWHSCFGIRKSRRLFIILLTLHL